MKRRRFLQLSVVASTAASVTPQLVGAEDADRCSENRFWSRPDKTATKGHFSGWMRPFK